jgi:hypothetical protein
MRVPPPPAGRPAHALRLSRSGDHTHSQNPRTA